MNLKITTFLTFNTAAEDALKLYTSTFKNSRPRHAALRPMRQARRRASS